MSRVAQAVHVDLICVVKPCHAKVSGPKTDTIGSAPTSLVKLNT